MTTITILVLSLRPYKFCCSDEKKGKKDKNDENSNLSDNNKDDKKLDLFLCNCVWTNPYGLIVMIIILFFLLGTTLYIPENPSLPKNLPFIDKMKLKIIGFFAAFKDGFMAFLTAVKTNIPAALKGKGGKILFGILALAAFIYTIYVISYTIKTVVLLFEVIAVEEPVDNAELCDPVVVGVEVDGFVVFIKCGVKVDEAVPGAVGVVDAELLVCIKYGVEADV